MKKLNPRTVSMSEMAKTINKIIDIVAIEKPIDAEIPKKINKKRGKNDEK